MLVLSRRVGERVLVGDNIWVQIVAVKGDKVRIGFTAPSGTPVNREEIVERMRLTAKDDAETHTTTNV